MLGTHHQTLSPSHHVVPDGNGFQGLMTLGSGSQQGSRKATEFKGDSRPFRSFETRLLSCRERKSLRRVGRSEKCQKETSGNAPRTSPATNSDAIIEIARAFEGSGAHACDRGSAPSLLPAFFRPWAEVVAAPSALRRKRPFSQSPCAALRLAPETLPADVQHACRDDQLRLEPEPTEVVAEHYHLT